MKKIGHFFRLLRDALTGKELDYTTGSIDRAVFLLAVPMVLEMVMESLFAITDAYFVSSLGKHAIATVGLTELVMTLVYTIGMGLSMGATALVARRTGEKEHDKAAKTAVQTLIIGISFGILLSLPGIFFPDKLLRIMGAEEEAIEIGTSYMKIMMSFNIVVLLLFLINGIFRGAGNAAIAMRSLWLANAINIILAPSLIFGWMGLPELGLSGAAWGTVIGRGCGVIYQFYYLFKGTKVLPVKAAHFTIDFSIIKRLIKTATGGTLQIFISSCSWIFLGRIVAEFHSEAIGGHTIAIRIMIFALLPAWGLANAAATLVGQNLGAGNPERAEKTVWRVAFLNMIVLGIISIIFIAFAADIVGLFTKDAGVLEYGSLSLKIVSIGYVFYAVGMVMPAAFNGAGDTFTPTLINFFGFWCFQIPLGYLLAIPFGYGPLGVFISIPVCETLIAIAGIILFRRGKWKKTIV